MMRARFGPPDWPLNSVHKTAGRRDSSDLAVFCNPGRRYRINYSPRRQRRPAATEATYLMTRRLASLRRKELGRSARKPAPAAMLERYRLPSPPIVREAMSELHRVGVNLNPSIRLPAMRTRPAISTGDMPVLAELRAIRGVLEAAVRCALDL